MLIHYSSTTMPQDPIKAATGNTKHNSAQVLEHSVDALSSPPFFLNFKQVYGAAGHQVDAVKAPLPPSPPPASFEEKAHSMREADCTWCGTVDELPHRNDACPVYQTEQRSACGSHVGGLETQRRLSNGLCVWCGDDAHALVHCQKRISEVPVKV